MGQEKRARKAGRDWGLERKKHEEKKWRVERGQENKKS